MTTTTLEPRTTRKLKATTAKPAAKPRAAKVPKPIKEPKPANATELKEATPREPSKIDHVVSLLRREEGATTKALMEATGWQAHSVRGIIAGAIKKKLGLAVNSEAGEGGRTYRITTEASA